MTLLSFDKYNIGNPASLLSQLPGLIMCMDLNHQFTFANSEAATIFGFKVEDELLGKMPHEIRCKAADAANTFIMQNKEVIESLKVIKLLDIHPYANDLVKIFLTTKLPFLNNNKQVVGAIVTCLEINSNHLSKIFMNIATSDRKYREHNKVIQRSYKIDDQYHNFKLSKQESLCLFYLIRGRSFSQIGAAMNLSKRTVEHYIENVKNKMDCHSKSELIEKAIDQDFLNFIPENLVLNGNNLSVTL
jgi:DNA-binding CsgD family transcriptional regulator